MKKFKNIYFFKIKQVKNWKNKLPLKTFFQNFLFITFMRNRTTLKITEMVKFISGPFYRKWKQIVMDFLRRRPSDRDQTAINHPIFILLRRTNWV